MKQTNSLEIILKQRVLPLFFHSNAEVCKGVIAALYEGGIRSVEFTNRGENALENFHVLKKQRDDFYCDLEIGVGTIKTEQEATAFIDAGADYIVCPGILPSVGAIVHSAGRLWIPGCMTSTEIMLGEQAGAKMVKLFPGSLLGPSFVTAVREIFPAMLFMPTGGVELTEQSFRSWFSAGVSVVGLGSKVITKEDLQNKNFQRITQLARQAITIVEQLKSAE